MKIFFSSYHLKLVLFIYKMEQKGMDFSYQIQKKYLRKITNGHLLFFWAHVKEKSNSVLDQQNFIADSKKNTIAYYFNRKVTLYSKYATTPKQDITDVEKVEKN